MAFTRPQISNKGKLFDIIELTLKADKTKYWGDGTVNHKNERPFCYINFTSDLHLFVFSLQKHLSLVVSPSVCHSILPTPSETWHQIE